VIRADNPTTPPKIMMEAASGTTKAEASSAARAGGTAASIPVARKIRKVFVIFGVESSDCGLKVQAEFQMKGNKNQ